MTRLLVALIAAIAFLLGAAWLNGRDLVDDTDYAYIPTGI